MNKKEIKTDKAPAAIGPYSQAIQTGNFIFTSGQIPINPVNGEIARKSIKSQTIQAFENLKAVLEESGAQLADVIKVTLFVKDLAAFVEINEVYATYFSEPYPARSCVEVSRLPKDVLIEIEAVAVV